LLECLNLHGPCGGCWYFVQGKALISLDGSTGDFSSSELPPWKDWDPYTVDRDFCITDGRDGKLRIFTVFDQYMKMFTKLEGGEWALEKHGHAEGSNPWPARIRSNFRISMVFHPSQQLVQVLLSFGWSLSGGPSPSTLRLRRRLRRKRA
jgi:hypothetical protein